MQPPSLILLRPQCLWLARSTSSPLQAACWRPSLSDARTRTSLDFETMPEAVLSMASATSEVLDWQSVERKVSAVQGHLLVSPSPSQAQALQPSLLVSQLSAGYTRFDVDHP